MVDAIGIQPQGTGREATPTYMGTASWEISAGTTVILGTVRSRQLPINNPVFRSSLYLGVVGNSDLNRISPAAALKW